MKQGKCNNTGKRIVASILSLLLVVTTLELALPQTALKVYASTEKSDRNIDLGVSNISNPSGAGQWNYVYYGKQFNGNYVRYRVLDKAATEFNSDEDNTNGRTTMLLDCDYVLLDKRFDDDSNVWTDSEVKGYLNGDFLTDNFEPLEQAAIAASSKTTASEKDGNGYVSGGSDDLAWTSLNSGENILLLDAKEATSPAYGYEDKYTSSDSRVKYKLGTTSAARWWLRSPVHNSVSRTGVADLSGYLTNFNVSNGYIGGVSPAFNIDLSSVIFSSAISSESGSYKLTIKDDSMFAGVASGQEVSRSGDTITVPYTVSNIANRVSVLITDGEYTLGSSPLPDMKYYGALTIDGGTIGTSGTGTFTLPFGYQDSWKVYILAEKTSGDDKLTDYASEPVEIFIPNGTEYTDAVIEKSDSNTALGVSNISNPSGAGQWNYVYYGKQFNGNYVRYRVLDKAATEFNSDEDNTNGRTTMLLDCDYVLQYKRFDDDSNMWADSEVKGYLNGDFLTDNFEPLEQAAIATSSKASASSKDGKGWVSDSTDYLPWTSLNNSEKIFLLDAKEATSTVYSYEDRDTSSDSRKKYMIGTTSAARWWLRSPYCLNTYGAGNMYSSGSINHGTVDSDYDGVSPAFNIDLSSVIFSSAISSESGSYKLTIKDEDMYVGVTSGQEITRLGNTITVPYTVSNVANRVSVLITDGEYTLGSSYLPNMKYYGALTIDGGIIGTSGTGTFTLPNEYVDKTCGTEYYAYILEEDLNGEFETDYASAPTPITIPSAPKPALTITAKDKSLEYNGQMLGPNGAVYGDPSEIAEMVTVSGLQDGDTLTSIVIDGHGQEVGDYELTPHSATVNGVSAAEKYDVTYVNGILHVFIVEKNMHLVTGGSAPNVSGVQVSSVYFGSYQQSGNGSGGYNIDPIKWRVLKNSDGKLFLLADQNLVAKKYNETTVAVTWETCTLRSWLNGTTSESFFNDAFADNEASVILTTNVANPDNSWWSVSGGNNTNDKIFLLSIDEVQNVEYGFLDNATRQSTNTKYVADGNTTNPYNGMFPEGQADFWWLRSPGRNAYQACYVDWTGNVQGDNDINSNVVVSTDVAVRPAINLDLSSVLFTSAAVGGKSSDTGYGAFEPVGTMSGNEWKLTVRDSSRNGFTAFRTDSEEVIAGDDISISYRGATTGTNEYVSAMLCNSNGDILYYASFMPESSGSGIWNMTIPDSLEEGNYTLKVFSEQQNGDKWTDYASTPVEIGLTVNNAAPKYAMTVTNGSGGGDYTAGASVTITANPPVYGKQFKEWTGADGLTFTSGSVTSATATFTMPTREVSVTATYEDASRPTPPGPTPHEHSYTSEVTTKPTCTEKGIRIYTCSCGDSYTEEIPALGHDYTSVITTQPTIFTEGMITYTCIRCDHSYTERVPKVDDGEDRSDLIKDVTDDGGNIKAKVVTKPNEDGGTITTVMIVDQEVERTVTDANGNVTVETSIWIGGLKSSYTYTGSAIKPSFHVYDGTKKLISGKDYSVSYKNNKSAGDTATIAISFKGNYKGTAQEKLSFSITPAVLGADVEATDVTTYASGKTLRPVPVMKWASTGKSIDKKNFSFTYKDSADTVIDGIKEAGQYKVVITSKNGSFTGETEAAITVTGSKKLLLSGATVKLSPNKYTYTGDPIIPASGTYTLKLNGKTLTEGTDYYVSDIRNNIEPGKATIVFTAKDGNQEGYVGEKSAAFTISKGRALKDGDGFTYSYSESVPYAKGGAKPTVVVKDGDDTLKAGTDYTVSYSKNTKVTNGATAVITITGKGNYKGSVKKYFTITKQDISKLAENIITADKVESKKGYKNPTVTITDLDGKKLKAGTDFAIDSDSYSGPDTNGVVTATVSGKGSYTGTASITYRYIKGAQQLSKVKAMKSLAGKTYTGREVRLTNADLTGILYTGSKSSPVYLIPGTDFKVVSYTNNTKTGTAKVTIQGIGAYGGSRTLSFKIIAKKGDYKGSLVGGEWQ